MTSNTHKVSTDALATLGTIIDDKQERDAIHLAVLPMKATKKLYPGQDIGLDCTDDTPVGIVDPFLKAPVLEGSHFWLIIYPRKITSLRHVWEHPDFDNVPIDKTLSKDWISLYAAGIGVGTQELLDAAMDWIRSEDYFSRGGQFEGVTLPDEFWDHYEVVTNTVVIEMDRGSFFSCSC